MDASCHARASEQTPSCLLSGTWGNIWWSNIAFCGGVGSVPAFSSQWCSVTVRPQWSFSFSSLFSLPKYENVILFIYYIQFGYYLIVNFFSTSPLLIWFRMNFISNLIIVFLSFFLLLIDFFFSISSLAFDLIFYVEFGLIWFISFFNCVPSHLV